MSISFSAIIENSISNATVKTDVVLGGSDGELIRYDTEINNKKWDRSDITGNAIQSIKIKNEFVYVGFSKNVYKLDLSTGATQWSVGIGGDVGDIVINENDDLFIASENSTNSNGYRVNSSGSIIWSKEFSNNNHTGVCLNPAKPDKVYFSISNSKVFEANKNDSSQANLVVEPSFPATPRFNSDGTKFAVGYGNTTPSGVKLYDSSFSEIWTSSLDDSGQTTTFLFFSNDENAIFYKTDSISTIRKIDIADGSELAKLGSETGDGSASDAFVDENDFVYVATGGDIIYAESDLTPISTASTPIFLLSKIAPVV